ncbi:MAG: 5'-deoxyadenosine deaminase [Syntrophomonadaceae bacterium]|nr:5'-deoxyadenosine deaminase [Syntrophomonadaceae bacterium]
MSILIKNATIVTMNENRDVFCGDLLIENDRISRIGKLDWYTADTVIDADNQLLLPGFVQSHIHLCQVLFRGMADDLELLDWLQQRIWPLEASHDEESLYYSSLLGCAEMLRGGTTSIIDMATVNYTESVFTAVKQAGIRYLGGKCLMDHGDNVPPPLLDTPERALQESLELYQRWNNYDNGRIRYALCPRFAVSCSDALLREVALLSQQYQIPVHTHASENRGEIELVEKERGMRNVIYLNSLGLCNDRLILAHCIHLNTDEMRLLAESRSNIVHCPSANLKLGSGIAPIPALLDMGARVSLGADGAPCNNNLSMFMEMRLAALIQKPFHGPRSMPAQTVVEMATRGGARAMGLEHEIGSLEEGKKADMVLISLDGWHTRPQNAASVYSQLVYQAQASDVTATIVNGHLLMKDGHLLSIDEKKLKSAAEASLQRVCRRAGLS